MIGNERTFGIDLIPVQPRWDLQYAPEAAAWAGLAIWVDGQNICQHIDPGSTDLRQHVFVPLGPIVDWLVSSLPALQYEERARAFPTGRALHEDLARWARVPPGLGLSEDDWFDERELWWTRHFLRAGADGAFLPDLAIVRDDEEMVLAWTHPRFASLSGPVMVWPEGASTVKWSDGFKVLKQLAREVASAFRDARQEHAYPWAPMEDPLDPTRVSLSDAVQLYTGRDLRELEVLTNAPTAEAAFETLGLLPDSLEPSESSQCQILRDLAGGLSADVGAAVIETGSRSARNGGTRSWRELREIARDGSAAGTSPELAGQLGATEVRRTVGLNGRPITDVPGLIRQFGVECDAPEVYGGLDRMIVAAGVDRSCIITPLITDRTKTDWGLRFEYARGLGHALLDHAPHGAIGAGSGPSAVEARRRRSGAFAAELLLPGTALIQESGGNLDGITRRTAFAGLLEKYGVGAQTAGFQLWNHDLLSTVAVRDELIDSVSP